MLSTAHVWLPLSSIKDLKELSSSELKSLVSDTARSQRSVLHNLMMRSRQKLPHPRMNYCQQAFSQLLHQAHVHAKV